MRERSTVVSKSCYKKDLSRYYSILNTFTAQHKCYSFQIGGLACPQAGFSIREELKGSKEALFLLLFPQSVCLSFLAPQHLTRLGSEAMP